MFAGTTNGFLGPKYAETKASDCSYDTYMLYILYDQKTVIYLDKVAVSPK